MLGPWKKNYDKLSILKSRDITLPSKIHLVKAMVFPVDMYGCESWTIMKAEHQRIDAFELWCWRRLLRVPWTARRSNQSILKEISPEYSLEGPYWSWSSNTLTTWCEELTHWKRPWCWERLTPGGEGDERGWDCWMRSPTQRMWVWANFRSWWRTGKPGVLQSMGSQRFGHSWATEQQLEDWSYREIHLPCIWRKKWIQRFTVKQNNPNIYIYVGVCYSKCKKPKAKRTSWEMSEVINHLKYREAG